MKLIIISLIGWFISSAPTIPVFNKLRTKYFCLRHFNIGKNTLFCSHIRLKGNVSIGKECNFNENVMIASTGEGKITIGDYVIVGPNVVMRNANHGIDSVTVPIRYQGKPIENIVIEDDVWIAANVVILPGAVIKKGAVIGVGAVVRGEIPQYAVAVGVPAKVIKYRNESVD